MQSWNSVALIEASLKELPVHAELGQSCLATKMSAPGPSLLGGSATLLAHLIKLQSAQILNSQANLF